MTKLNIWVNYSFDEQLRIGCVACEALVYEKIILALMAGWSVLRTTVTFCKHSSFFSHIAPHCCRNAYMLRHSWSWYVILITWAWTVWALIYDCCYSIAITRARFGRNWIWFYFFNCNMACTELFFALNLTFFGQRFMLKSWFISTLRHSSCFGCVYFYFYAPRVALFLSLFLKCLSVVICHKVLLNPPRFFFHICKLTDMSRVISFVQRSLILNVSVTFTSLFPTLEPNIYFKIEYLLKKSTTLFPSIFLLNINNCVNCCILKCFGMCGRLFN